MTPRRPPAVRMQYGRGGRVFLDRRDPTPQRLMQHLPRSLLFPLSDEGETSSEVLRRQKVRRSWKNDGSLMLTICHPLDQTVQRNTTGSFIDDYDTGYLFFLWSISFRKGLNSTQVLEALYDTSHRI